MPIKAVAMDVDGVLTDGGVWLDESGRESKRLSFADIMGVSIGRRAGLEFALISGEGGPLFEIIAAKLGIADKYPGCKDKAGAVRDYASRRGFDLAEICYIGDDVNDLPAMDICGLAVVPAGSQLARSHDAVMVTTRARGDGAVRECIDWLLSGDSEWQGSGVPPTTAIPTPTTSEATAR